MNISYEQIRRLYLEKLSGTISEEEESCLQKALEQSSEARAAWNALEKENKDLDARSVLNRINPERELRQWKKRSGKQAPTPAGYSWHRWIAAATFVVSLGLAYYFWQHSYHKTPTPELSTALETRETADKNTLRLILGNGETVAITKGSPEEFSLGNIRIRNTGEELHYDGTETASENLNRLFVPVKEEYAVTLSDGSRVFLNSDTELHFPFYFSSDRREVFVKGEAYFEVAQNARVPFIVHTPLNDIQVTGTRFNVNTYEEGQVQTSLIEGSVSVRTAGTAPIPLTPGMQATYKKSKGFFTQRFEEGEVLSWRNGIYYFHQTQLADLSGVIARWFGVKVVFGQQTLEQFRVSGMLEKGQLAEFLDDLQATSNIRYILEDNILTLNPNK